MSTIRQTATSNGNTHADPTIAAHLIRWTGLAAVGGGIIFVGIQPIHPPDVVASVTTSTWAIITTLKTAMCLMFLLGIGGIYARQANKAGWLGLAGWFLFSLSWALQLCFVFAETFILPLLATTAPQFVDGFLRNIAGGEVTSVDLGALPVIYGIGVGGLYMLGGVVFGLATLRAAVLPRWAAGLLAVAALLTPAAALFPHNIQRFAAVPVAFALAALGYALWAERRARTAAPVPSPVSPQLGQTGAK
ncbi:MAG TPA: hypothetical protein VF276_01575 [Chloroflexia bacterium]